MESIFDGCVDEQVYAQIRKSPAIKLAFTKLGAYSQRSIGGNNIELFKFDEAKVFAYFDRKVKRMIPFVKENSKILISDWNNKEIEKRPTYIILEFLYQHLPKKLFETYLLRRYDDTFNTFKQYRQAKPKRKTPTKEPDNSQRGEF